MTLNQHVLGVGFSSEHSIKLNYSVINCYWEKESALNYTMSAVDKFCFHREPAAQFPRQQNNICHRTHFPQAKFERSACWRNNLSQLQVTVEWCTPVSQANVESYDETERESSNNRPRWSCKVADFCSGDGVGHIYKIKLCRAQMVLGLVTLGKPTTLVIYPDHTSCLSLHG